MATFVLVSGSWHGAWCWEYVIPQLEVRGHRAVAAELPGMGADRTPLAVLDAALVLKRNAAELAGQRCGDDEEIVLIGRQDSRRAVGEATVDPLGPKVARFGNVRVGGNQFDRQSHRLLSPL